jgi:hypothetical protein
VEPVIAPKTRKRPAWLESTLQEAEKHKAPSGTFRQSKKPKRFSSYAALMTSIVNAEPSTFEEAVKQKEWKEAMTEEYQSIMKNDVWEEVLTNTRRDLWLEVSLSRREKIMMRRLLWLPDIHLLEPSYL